MKQVGRFIFFIGLFSWAMPYSFAQTDSILENERIQVMRYYIRLLGDGNYQVIPHLFTEKAVAVSSSGVPDNPGHFYETLFTKTITHPKATLLNVFPGTLDENMMTVYFNFSWKNSKQQRVSAKFLDLFIFQRNTAKINAVYIFSNTFQKDIMKQFE